MTSSSQETQVAWCTCRTLWGQAGAAQGSAHTVANLTYYFTERGAAALLLKGLPLPLHCLWSDNTEE